jgi:NAD(P)-dependent dehydrogenase (short-subunit alcohol dehydrogenase family)
VNAVARGVTDTEISRAASPPEVQQHMIHNAALGRVRTPEDLADIVTLAASDDAGWITGQFIEASGGLRF